jgi:hypothetical protein
VKQASSVVIAAMILRRRLGSRLAMAATVSSLQVLWMAEVTLRQADAPAGGDDFEAAGHEIVDGFDADEIGRYAGILLGFRTLEEPGGRVPVRAGGGMQGMEGAEFGFELAAADFVGKIGVAEGLAADGAAIAADELGNTGHAATGFEQGADSGTIDFVEDAAAAGHGVAPGWEEVASECTFVHISPV